ncbi:lipase maturation factor family protein [Thiohalocapsa sp. ML1]|jgi:lipase maturation factor 1|uniref:lipase maturation factor family protein n=1 Tax=Thiohalocapsa sp. ML1 TaxID=1431688 RepID=UPI0007320105|nr:lipase maturation factor family protein [Thiohalocapsa sp. ML1]
MPFRPSTDALPAPNADAYRIVGWLFLRALGLIYVAAFASLAVQITALAGSQGIAPVTEQLARAGELYGGLKYLRHPTLFWLNASDLALLAVAWGGVLLGLLLALGRNDRALLILLYLFYLSLYHAGHRFTNFQWDYLLLEVGFVAILLPGGGRLVVWLFRWVLFKLRFLSGLAKLLSGDEAWRQLTALRYYFETQPLPHAGAWYAHQLPDWVLRVGAGGTLFAELVVPFFFLLPRPYRHAAAWLTILWQLLIIATSNHNFINLLTIALCLFLFDDRAVARLLPRRVAAFATARSPLPQAPRRLVGVLSVAVALLVVPAGLVSAAEMLRRGPITHLSGWLDRIEPYRIANRYHVFPSIDRERIVLVVEASRNGQDWVSLDWRYAPDAPREIAPFIVPHQPRWDWQLWFLPKGPLFRPDLKAFLNRLREGAPAVTALLAEPPFGDKPPKMLRVRAYRYRFATPAERAADGIWWVREDLGAFLPLPQVPMPIPPTR